MEGRLDNAERLLPQLAIVSNLRTLGFASLLHTVKRSRNGKAADEGISVDRMELSLAWW